MIYEDYIGSLITDSTYDDIREDTITCSVNMRNFIMNPQLECSNIYYDIQEEMIRRIVDQMVFDMDEEIRNSLGLTNPNSLHPSYIIDDINIYRKEILIKKYGFK